MLKYSHPTLGRFKRFSYARGSGIGGVYVSELELEGLLGYLNEATTPDQKRILGILQQMQELGGLEPPQFTERIDGPLMVEGADGINLPNPELEKVAPEKYRRQLDIDLRQAALNKELSRYRFIPYACTPTGANKWFVTWQRLQEQPNRLDEGMTEGRALELILNLARAGNLHRLRHCTHCQLWLYANFRHQEFCSNKCQQKHYTQSEDWKAHRREYMRDYYRNNYARPDKGKSSK
jgi:hypothetical protein